MNRDNPRAATPGHKVDCICVDCTDARAVDTGIVTGLIEGLLACSPEVRVKIAKRLLEGAPWILHNTTVTRGAAK